MKTRMDLHEILCENLCSPNCYYSPPSSIRMKYPCMVYHADGIDTKYADDTRYLNKKRYTITIIDECAESDIPDRLLNDVRLKYLKMDRSFIAEGLSHFVFTLYF